MADATPAPAAPAAPPPAASPPPKAPVRPTPKAPVVEAKPEAGKAPAGAPEGPRKVKFKDHRQQEIELDERELAAIYHRGKGDVDATRKFNQRLEELRKKEADFASRQARLKDDPAALRAFLAEHGYDPRKLGEEFVLAGMEDDKLSPEAKELREERAKREALEAKEQQREEEQRQQAHHAAVEQHTAQLADLFTEGLAAAGVPEDGARLLFPAMAGLYRASEAAAKAGAPPLDVAHVARYLRAAHEKVVRAYFDALPLDRAEEVFGEREINVEQNGQQTKVRLPLSEIVHRRKLADLHAKRQGIPGVAPQPVTGGAVVGYNLPSEVIRNAPADVQGAYYAMQRATPEELPGKKQRFEAVSQKYGIKIR